MKMYVVEYQLCMADRMSSYYSEIIIDSVYDDKAKADRRMKKLMGMKPTAYSSVGEVNVLEKTLNRAGKCTL